MNDLRVSSSAWPSAESARMRRIREPEKSKVRREAMIEAARGFRADVRFSYPQWFDDADAER